MESQFFFNCTHTELKALLKEVVQEALAESRVHQENQTTLINMQEAAALLNLAVATLYEKTSQKLIPHYKHGKKIMFKKSELLAWIETRRVKTIHEIRKEAHHHVSRS